MNISIGILKKYQIGLNVFPYRFLQLYNEKIIRIPESIVLSEWIKDIP